MAVEGLSFKRFIPPYFETYQLVRSWAASINGQLVRVEVRKDPVSGRQVQVTRPMPHPLVTA
jgi:hypothetical protein